MADAQNSGPPQGGDSSPLHSFAEFQASLNKTPPPPAPSNNPAAKQAPASGKAAAREHIAEAAAAATAEDQNAGQQQAQGDATAPQGTDAEPNPDDLLEPEQPATDPQEAATKYKEWLDSPDLPAEFLDKLVEVPVGKHKQTLKLSDVVKGYGSKREATRMVNEGITAKREAEQIRTTYDQHFEAVRKSPEDFVEVYERNGFDLVAVAKLIAKREAVKGKRIRAIGEHTIRELGGDIGNDAHWADPRVVQAMKDEEALLEADRQRDIKLREREAEIRQLQAAQQQVTAQEDTKAMQAEGMNAYNQLAPIAFKAHGLKDNQINRGKHLQYVKELIAQEGYSYNPDDHGGKPWRWQITRQHCLDAAQMLKEEILERQGAPVQPSRAVNGSRQMGLGAGGQRQPVATQESKPIGSYRDFLNDVNGR